MLDLKLAVALCLLATLALTYLRLLKVGPDNGEDVLLRWLRRIPAAAVGALSWCSILEDG